MLESNPSADAGNDVARRQQAFIQLLSGVFFAPVVETTIFQHGNTPDRNAILFGNEKIRVTIKV